MAKIIDFLRIAVISISSFTKELIAQLDDKVEDIIITGALLLLICSFVYLFFCYLTSLFSKPPHPGQRMRRKYLSMFLRTIIWIIFSATLGVIYYTVVIMIGSTDKFVAYCGFGSIFAIIVYYGALFAIP